MTSQQEEYKYLCELCEELQEQCDHTERTLRKHIKRLEKKNALWEKIADSICILCIGISVYFAFYGLAAFLQWCSTGTWI